MKAGDLRIRRVNLNIGLKDMAEELGVSQSFLSRFEREPRREHRCLAKMYDALLTDIEQGRKKMKTIKGIPKAYYMSRLGRPLQLELFNDKLSDQEEAVKQVQVQKNEEPELTGDAPLEVVMLLSSLRRELGVSAEEAAQEIDYGSDFLLMKEYGECRMSLFEAKRLLEFYARKIGR